MNMTNIDVRHSIRTWATVVATALLAIPTGIGAQQQIAPLAAAPDSPLVIEDDAPLFRAFDKVWTKADFVKVAELAPPGGLALPTGGLADLESVPADQLRQNIERVVAALAATQSVDGDPMDALADNTRGRLEAQLARQAQMAWIERNGFLDLEDPGDDVLRIVYETNRSMFERRETLQLRHIFLSTYEEYVVKAGDTLASIAESITGDPARAGDILDPATEGRRPRIETVEMEDGSELEPKPLQEGEVLLVPMSEAGVREVLERGAEIHQMLAQGRDFVELANQFSQSPRKGQVLAVEPVVDGRPVLPAITEEFMKLENGDFSEPFATKHGVQIIQRLSYTPEGAQSFDQVRNRLRQMWEGQKQQEMFMDTIKPMWAEAPVEVDMDVLANIMDPARSEAVIFQIGDVKYPAESFRQDFPLLTSASTSAEARREELVTLPVVQQFLINQAIEEQGIRETPEFTERRDAMIGQYLLSDRIQAAIGLAGGLEPTELEMQEAMATRDVPPGRPRMVRLWSITKTANVPPNAPEEQRLLALEVEKEKLARLLEPVTTVAQFEELARQVSEDPYADAGGRRGELPEIEKGRFITRLIDDVPENSIYGPAIEEGAVVAFWVGSKRLPDPVEEANRARQFIRNQLRAEKRAAAETKVLDELLEQAGYEFLAPLD